MTTSDSELAGFLDASRDRVITEFEARALTLAPRPESPTEIRNSLPEFLDEIAAKLRRADVASASTLAAEHGLQRLRLGYDVDTVVREYRVLSDCILDHVTAAALVPTVQEMRILTDCISGAAADAVSAFAKQRELTTSTERRHLVELLQQAPGFVAFLRGPELVFELANAAYYQLVGHRDIIDKPVRTALPEVAGQGFFELLEGVMSTGTPFVGRSMPVKVQRSPGARLSEAYVDFIYQPIVGADGSAVGILAQGHDVTAAHLEATARAASDAALRESEQRYRTLFDSIDDGFALIEMIFDRDDRAIDYLFLEANAAFEQQTGLHDVIGKTARVLVPDLGDDWYQLYGKVALTGQPARTENHAPAMHRWFDLYANRVGDPAQRRVAIVFKDVTERRAAAVEMERLLKLESAARADAETASRLRDEFLATVSHELRTPLSAILGWVQLLRAETVSAEKQARALETIERNARAQAQLIEDLLDVSRILAGQLRIEVQQVEVRTVVEAALETVRPAALSRDIRLQSTLATAAVVMGDVHRLQQVVWNLLSNAVKFTPKGGRVQILVTQLESSVEISVADTGKGISQEFQPHVFDRFRQADGATTRSYGGLGLGLSIVREIITLHGGTVSVFSEGEGQGSTFTVRLPLAVSKRPSRERQAPQLPKAITCPPQLSGMRVLVLDDEVDTRDMLQALLVHCGVIVTAAGSVAEAIAALATFTPDLILSDIGMPEEDGYAFIGKVRAMPGAVSLTPAVALTAYARTEDRARALHAGFDNHVAKPVEPLELLAVAASFARRGRRG